MKKDTHPEMHPVLFVDSSNSIEFKTLSTVTSEETRDIDGVTYYVIKMEVTSASHPFYTGKQRFVDTTGQVEKFQKRTEKVKAVQSQSGKTVSKKSKRLSKDKKKAARAALKDAFQD